MSNVIESGIRMLDDQEIEQIAGAWFGSSFFKGVAEVLGGAAPVVAAIPIPGFQKVGAGLGIIAVGAWGVSKL